jgi:leucyl aminopeptidase
MRTQSSSAAVGGASVGANFLSRFVNGVPWAHLDIAGTAFGAPATETNAGWAPGFGVALLDRLVRDNYEG